MNSPEIRKFVKQDIEKLLPETAQKIGAGITGLAGFFNILFGGKKKRKKVIHQSKPPIKVEQPMIGNGVVRFNWI